MNFANTPLLYYNLPLNKLEECADSLGLLTEEIWTDELNSAIFYCQSQ